MPRQLNKSIVPVLLENEKNFENTWLGMIIISLNKVNMQDESQLDYSVDILVQHINKALEEKQGGDSHRPQVITRFEGGAVKGKYYQYGQAFVKHELKGSVEVLRVEIWTHPPAPPPQT